MYNYIFDKGIYPKSWCNGVIVPIFKKGDRSCAENYRGITLINVIAKIFSTLLRNRINKWCEDENIFNQAQFGFRDKRSNVDCILNYILLFKMCYTTHLNCIGLLLIMRKHLIL